MERTTSRTRRVLRSVGLQAAIVILLATSAPNASARTSGDSRQSNSQTSSVTPVKAGAHHREPLRRHCDPHPVTPRPTTPLKPRTTTPHKPRTTATTKLPTTSAISKPKPTGVTASPAVQPSIPTGVKPSALPAAPRARTLTTTPDLLSTSGTGSTPVGDGLVWNTAPAADARPAGSAATTARQRDSSAPTAGHTPTQTVLGLPSEDILGLSEAKLLVLMIIGFAASVVGIVVAGGRRGPTHLH